MSVSREYLDFIMDKLMPDGDFTGRAMFSGYGIFHAGLMFALISDDILYFKVDDTNREMYEKAGSSIFPHGISYWAVPEEVIEDNEKLYEWADISIRIAGAAASKKRKKRR
jgi:DNA transformation protein